MPYRVTIEGAGAPVSAEDGETILEALLRNGVGFPYSCQAGNCGSCKCEHVSGEIFELEYSDHALSAAERSRGVILACRTQVWGDVAIRRLSEEDFILHPSRVLHCSLVEFTPLTHDIYRLRLAIDAGGPFTFSPGQYAQLEFGFAPGTVRDYSMASLPEDDLLEFHIRAVAGGAVSQLLPGRLRVGDTVRVCGPFGTSYLRAAHPGPILAIAGGSGLAPIRSIVAAALRQGRSAPLRLYFGARAERDVYGEEELLQWQAAHPNLRVHVVLSEPGRDALAAERRSGLVTDAVGADLPDLAGFQAYLAGPPAMVEAATDLLLSRGMQRRDLHADAFYTAAEQAQRHKAVA